MTAPAPMLPVQQAIYTTLTGNTALMDTVSGVFDYVPETVAYPFVVIGEAIETPDNAHDRFGRETVVTLHVWSQYRGFSQVLAIAAKVTALLDHRPLTITGLDHIATRFEFSQTLTDPEPPGDIRHVVLRYRVVTEQPILGEAMPAYVFSVGNLAGVVAANTFLTLTNPAGSGRNIALSGVFISAMANAASATTVSMRGFRATGVSGGTLQPSSDIGKFATADPDPFAEVRINNPAATLGAPLFNSPPPTSAAAYSSGFVHQVPIPPGLGEFILTPGEGLALRTAQGDTAQRWNISVVWAEKL